VATEELAETTGVEATGEEASPLHTSGPGIG
jgi:hypothetical protein